MYPKTKYDLNYQLKKAIHERLEKTEQTLREMCRNSGVMYTKEIELGNFLELTMQELNSVTRHLKLDLDEVLYVEEGDTVLVSRVIPGRDLRSIVNKCNSTVTRFRTKGFQIVLENGIPAQELVGVC